MSREVVYRGKCDVCGETSIFAIDSPTDTNLNLDVPFAFGPDLEVVLLDLCDEHYGELERDAYRWLEVGRPPLPGTNPFAQQSSKKPAPKKEKARAAAATAPAAAVAGYPRPCDVGECTEVLKTPQGYGSHRKYAHGILGQSKEAKRRRALKEPPL